MVRRGLISELLILITSFSITIVASLMFSNLGMCSDSDLLLLLAGSIHIDATARSVDAVMRFPLSYFISYVHPDAFRVRRHCLS